MPARVKKFQIYNNKIGQLIATGFTASGTNDTVTTAINTAAENDDVALIPSDGSESSLGFIVTTNNNKVEIVDDTRRSPIVDNAGNRIFGRLTKVTAIYILSYFSVISGVETTASIDQDIAFFPNYNFIYHQFPFNNSARRINETNSFLPIPTLIGGEVLTIATVDILPDLANVPIVGSVTLVVNGKTEDSATGGAFTVSGSSLTWNAANAGYSIRPNDRVIAIYNTITS